MATLRGHRQAGDTETGEDQGEQRVTARLAADAHRLARELRAVAGVADDLEHRRLPGSSRSESWPSIRSAAIVYCARSLVPSEPKSTSARTCRERIAAPGTSIITPTEGSPCSRTRRANQAASSGVATIGAMT